MNYFPFHIGDYVSATSHLSWEEDLAYLRLLQAYYRLETPLPVAKRELYRLVRATEERQREAVDTVLEEFFELRHDGWHNNRADEEIAKAQLKKEKAKQSAAVRWQDRPHTDRNANASPTHANASPSPANAMPTQCEGNAPNPNPNPNIEDDGRIARARQSRELFAKTEIALRAIPEAKDHPVALDTVIAPIFRLAEQGLDLERQIVPSIRRQLQAAKRPVKRWGYFVDGIVQDATATPTGDRPNGPQRRKTPAQQLADAFDRVEAHIAGRDPSS